MSYARHRYRVCCDSTQVKVRVRKTPRESQVDGVGLDRFKVGDVREVTPILAAWLVAQGYAVPEMRKTVNEYEHDFSTVTDVVTESTTDDRPRRRRNDR